MISGLQGRGVEQELSVWKVFKMWMHTEAPAEFSAPRCQNLLQDLGEMSPKGAHRTLCSEACAARGKWYGPKMNSSPVCEQGRDSAIQARSAHFGTQFSMAI